MKNKDLHLVGNGRFGRLENFQHFQIAQQVTHSPDTGRVGQTELVELLLIF